MYGRTVALLALGMAVAAGASSTPPSLNELVHAAERVVAGRITSSETVQQEIVFNEDGDRTNVVMTYLEVEATDHMKGEAVSRLTIRVLGGPWEGDAIVDTEGPSLALQEDVLLFLSTSETGRDGVGGPVFYLPHGRFGKFRLEDRGRQTVATRRAPMSSLSLGVDEGAGGDHWVDYAALRRLIEAEKARPPQALGHARER